MPIKGLTEKRRLPRIGKLHLGVMAETPRGVKYPRAVDHFVYPQDGLPGAELKNELTTKFGEKTRELRIIFPLEDEEKIASQYYRCYSKTRGLVCKGDGETCTRMVTKGTGNLADRDSQQVEMKELPCRGRECIYYNKQCRELMNLQFILPEISGLGIWQIDTSSINSIRNINGNLDMLRAVYGRVSMVPLILALEQVEVTNPEDGKKKKVWVLNLRSTDNMVQAAIKARMKPLELITGIKETITPEEVIETPVPDDERPDLVAPDWEPEGEPIVPHPEDAGKHIEDFWPDGHPAAEVIQKAQGGLWHSEDENIPSTEEKLLSWVAVARGFTTTKTARTFLVTRCNIKPERLAKDPKSVYFELREKITNFEP